MTQRVTGTIHFMDGTKLSLRWPRQAGTGAQIIASNVSKALEANRFLVEVDGALLLIPACNVKYIQIEPAPEKLPLGVLRGVEMVG